MGCTEEHGRQEPRPASETYLPRPFRDEVFSFYGKVLQDQPEPEPRWKMALIDLGWDGRPLSDALSKAFVERYVPADARPQIQAMVKNLLVVFDARLAKLSWMTEETRKGARDKLAKVTIKVVYPDEWLDSEGLEVVRGDAIGNARRGMAFVRRRELSWLESTPDRRIFFKPVFQVNAYGPGRLLRAAARQARQRPAHARREHRRPGRPDRGL